MNHYKKRITAIFDSEKTRAVLLALVSFFLLVMALPLPDPLFPSNYSTLLQARDGRLLSVEIASDEQWRFPPADSIPSKFKTALRLYEDEYFYQHPGINPVALGRAMYQNIRSGKVVSGGSTLSMQTIRMALGNQERTYPQKVYEMLLALKLEILYSKEEILRLYAYHAPYGGNIVGLTTASWRYYGRPPYQLSWAETASLAILPNNPASVYPGRNEAIYLKKRNRLILKLKAKGYITEEEAFLAQQERLPGNIKPLPNLAYHLLHRAKQEGQASKVVRSSLDFKLQRKVKEKVNRYSSQLAFNEIHNAAALVIDIQTGKALAYVGNVDRSEEDHGQHVDVITSRRSPGSLLKPLLYAAALDDGLLMPEELLPDIPMFYKGFAPQNFDKKFRGAVPAHEALASSLNVPFVFLLREYGYEKLHQKLKDMGMHSLDQPAGHYGLSLILGGAESTLWELTGLYAGMGRVYFNYLDRPYRSGYSDQDYRPNDYFFSTEKPKENLREYGQLSVPSVAYTFQAMQRLRRPAGQNGWQLFGSSRPIAWKTGTSYGFRDAWAIGLNNRYVVGVWIGNADGEGRPGLTGVSAASPLMFDVFSILDGDAEFDLNFGAVEKVCKTSGLRATDFCTETKSLQLPEYMVQGKQCSYHQLINLDSSETFQVNSSCYPVSRMKQLPWFVLPAAQAWYYKQYHPNYTEPPKFKSSCQTPANTGIMELIYPRQFTKVYVPVEQDGKAGLAIFEAAHRDQNAKVFWHLDDQYLGVTEQIHQMGIRTEQGPHTLTLVDEEGNRLSQDFEVLN